MAEFWYDLFHNEIIMVPFCSWLIAQILKTIIYMITFREFNPERLMGDGGMPSAHSATVMALVTVTGLKFGAGGFEFAIAGVFALVTMHDAMGVRRETGKQAKVIKSMAELFENMGKDIPGDEKLKEFVGHTPLQVMMGALLGVIAGFAFHALWV